jgi:hypothetical protein
MASGVTAGSGRAPSARAVGDEVARSGPFEWLARSGFVARGLIYGIIGILAVKLALGQGGKTTNQQGALRTIAHQPFGQLLMILVAVGLGGYALWRLVRAALGRGPESSDSGPDRIAALGSGVVYAGLCVLAVELLTGSSGTSSNSSSPHKAAAGVLGWPGGVWLVAGAGIVMIAVALYQGYRGLSKDFLDDSKTEQMSRRTRQLIERIGVIGHLARMIVFGLIGVFLIKAAVDYRPKAAIGVDGALAKLAHQTYGHVLLGIVAAGLIAFALYSLSDARYRKI